MGQERHTYMKTRPDLGDHLYKNKDERELYFNKDFTITEKQVIICNTEKEGIELTVIFDKFMATFRIMNESGIKHFLENTNRIAGKIFLDFGSEYLFTFKILGLSGQSYKTKYEVYRPLLIQLDKVKRISKVNSNE